MSSKLFWIMMLLASSPAISKSAPGTPATWTGRLERGGTAWRPALSGRGGARDASWVLHLAPSGDRAIPRGGARIGPRESAWIVGAQAFLAPRDPAGWSSALAVRRPRRSPALGAASGEVGLSRTGRWRAGTWTAAAGRTAGGEPRARFEACGGPLTFGVLRLAEGGRLAAQWLSTAGGLPVALDVLGGGRRLRARAAGGGGSVPGGVIAEAGLGRGGGWRVRGGLRTGAATGGTLEVEAARTGDRDDASALGGLSVRKGDVSLRADVRARRGAPLRGRAEWAAPAGRGRVDLATEVDAGRLTAVEVAYAVRSSRVRLRLPVRGATRASASAVRGIGAVRVRVFADWRRAEASAIGVEWSVGSAR